MRDRKIILYALLFLFLVLTAKESSASSDYIIRVSYGGPITLHSVEVLLYDIDRACDTLIESPTEEPSTDVAWTSLVIFPDAEGEIPDQGLNISGDRFVQLHYAVARAKASDGAGGGTDYFVTFGCNDVIPELVPGSESVIEIDMHNLWPEVKGTYRIETEADLLDTIPDEYDPVARSIKEFFQDPGLGLLRIVALAATGEQYYEEDPWDKLFKCREAPNRGSVGPCRKVAPTRLGKLAARILEDHIDTNLSALLGARKANIRKLLASARDVFKNAESFSLSGNLVVTQDADPAGLLGNSNSIAFNEITWVWEENERTIQLRDESFIRGVDIEASQVFHPDYPDVYSLEVAPFALSLNYAEMLIWVLEGVVLPESLGDEINSFSDLFTELVDCAALSDRLMCQGEFADDPDCHPKVAFAADMIKAGCEAMKTRGHEVISLWMASLIPEIDTWFQIGTPPERPCPMAFSPGSDEFKVQSLGALDPPEDRCEWEGEIIIYPDYDVKDFHGEWWGERL